MARSDLGGRSSGVKRVLDLGEGDGAAAVLAELVHVGVTRVAMAAVVVRRLAHEVGMAEVAEVV